MKMITTFLKKHYKKILCAITCSVIAFCSVLALAPQSVSASESTSVIDLKAFYKRKFTDEYFDTYNNPVYSGSNVKVESSIDFSFGYYTKYDFDNNKAYEYYTMGSNVTSAFMRPAKGHQDNIVISSNFAYDEFKLIYNNIAIPVPITFTAGMLNNPSTRIDAFRKALDEWLTYKYLYMEYLPTGMFYDISLSSIGLGNNSSNEYSLITHTEEYVTGLNSLGSIFRSFVNSIPTEYIDNYSFYYTSDYVNEDADMLVDGFFVIPYLSLRCYNYYNTYNAIYFVDYHNTTFDRFYDYSFQNCLSSYYLYGNDSINYNVIYNMGYDNGFSAASNLNNSTPFGLILDTVENFLSLEVFPDFPIYYLFLFGVGVTIFSLILKFALGG